MRRWILLVASALLLLFLLMWFMKEKDQQATTDREKKAFSSENLIKPFFPDGTPSMEVVGSFIPSSFDSDEFSSVKPFRITPAKPFSITLPKGPDLISGFVGKEIWAWVHYHILPDKKGAGDLILRVKDEKGKSSLDATQFPLKGNGKRVGWKRFGPFDHPSDLTNLKLEIDAGNGGPFHLESFMVVFVGQKQLKKNYFLGGENFPSDGKGQLVEKGGEQVVRMEKDQAYSRGISFNTKRTDLSGIEKARVSVRVQSDDVERPMKLVLQVSDSAGKARQWISAQPTREDLEEGEWKTLRRQLKLKHPLPEGAKVDFYLWNPDKATYYWDDMKVVLYSGKKEKFQKDGKQISKPVPFKKWHFWGKGPHAPWGGYGLPDTLFIANFIQKDPRRDEILWLEEGQLGLTYYNEGLDKFQSSPQQKLPGISFDEGKFEVTDLDQNGVTELLVMKHEKGKLFGFSEEGGKEISILWEGKLPEFLHNGELIKAPDKGQFFVDGTGTLKSIKLIEGNWELVEHKGFDVPGLHDANTSFLLGWLDENGVPGTYKVTCNPNYFGHAYLKGSRSLKQRTFRSSRNTPPFFPPSLNLLHSESTEKAGVLLFNDQWRFDLKQAWVEENDSLRFQRVRFHGYPGKKDPFFYEDRWLLTGDLLGDGNTELLLFLWNVGDAGEMPRKEGTSPLVQVYTQKVAQ